MRFCSISGSIHSFAVTTIWKREWALPESQFAGKPDYDLEAGHFCGRRIRQGTSGIKLEIFIPMS